jgi:hypothetical protein
MPGGLGSLPAQSRRPTVVLDAAVRPVEPDIRASCSIMSAGTSVCGQSRLWIFLNE